MILQSVGTRTWFHAWHELISDDFRGVIGILIGTCIFPRESQSASVRPLLNADAKRDIGRTIQPWLG
jgi:hypothetical protein